MSDNQPKIDSTAKVSMDNTGIIIHLMIAGVMVGLTVISWSQIKVDTPEQREATFKVVQSALKHAVKVTANIFIAGIHAEIEKNQKGNK
jgi:hypothetical protein